MKKSILMHVSFPPPYNGQARNSKRIYEYLVSLDKYYIKLLTYPSKSNNTSEAFGYYYKRVKLYFKCLWQLRNNDIIYTCAETGNGLYFIIILSWASFLFKKKLILHFRSREIITNNNKFNKFIKWDYDNLYNIVLCHSYCSCLKKLYSPKNVFVISNLSLYKPIRNIKINKNKKAFDFTFFSNMIQSKGILRFIKIASYLNNHKFILAGNNNNNKLDLDLRNICTSIPNLEYRPDINNIEDILNQSSCLIFPSEYPVEVEPNVIYEFLLNDKQVISTNIGCVNDIDNISGLKIFKSRGNEFVNDVVKYISTNYNSNYEIDKTFLIDKQQYSLNKLRDIFD